MKTETTSHLRALRTARETSVTELARLTGVSRQTIHSIEAGDYVPNTALALKLARALDVRVEELFSLTAEPVEKVRELAAELLGTPDSAAARLCRVGNKTIAIPVSAVPLFLPTADGVLSSVVRTYRDSGKNEDARTHPTIRARVSLFDRHDADRDNRLLIAGCDPAISVLADELRAAGIEVITAPCSSSRALQWLKQGKVHVAGSHLRDARTGEFNLPQVKHLLPSRSFRVVTFAEWEEGFVLPAGNPQRFRGVTHLARPDMRIVNREPGAGARSLLDRVLHDAGIPSERVRGYDNLALGHLPAAWQVSVRKADCCIASAAAARLFGLHFIPLQAERYDFVVSSRFLDMPAVQRLLEALNHGRLRRKLEAFAGYTTTHTGAMRA